MTDIMDLVGGVKVTWKNEVTLSDERVAAHLAKCLQYGTKVMVADRYRWNRRSSHYRVRVDGGGLFIRQAKRGELKKYLTACDITFLDGKPTLFQFHLRSA